MLKNCFNFNRIVVKVYLDSTFYVILYGRWNLNVEAINYGKVGN